MLRNSARFGSANRWRYKLPAIRRPVTYCCGMARINQIESVSVVAGCVVVHVDCDMRYRRSDDNLRTLALSGPAARQLYAKLGAMFSDPDLRPALESIGALRLAWPEQPNEE